MSKDPNFNRLHNCLYEAKIIKSNGTYIQTIDKPLAKKLLNNNSIEKLMTVQNFGRKCLNKLINIAQINDYFYLENYIKHKYANQIKKVLEDALTKQRRGNQ